MVFPVADTNDEEVKEFIKKISAICTGEKFHALRKELEIIYWQNNIENAVLTAFQDALFTLLSEESQSVADQPRRY